MQEVETWSCTSSLLRQLNMGGEVREDRPKDVKQKELRARKKKFAQNQKLFEDVADACGK